jgi:NTP pyrophosphatase (non-canonical NTP hydrolase)
MNLTPTNQVLIEVAGERMRQEVKWGQQDHGAHGWLPILTEEFGEVGKAMCENDPVNLREELIQVAAVAAAWVECIDRNKTNE